MIRDEDALWLAVVTLVVAVTWSYDLLRAGHALATLTIPHARYTNARALFRSAVIMVGLTRIALGSFARAYPGVHWIQTAQDFLAPILTLFLLTGGIVMIVLWRFEDNARKQGPM